MVYLGAGTFQRDCLLFWDVCPVQMANAMGRHHGALTCVWPFPVPAHSSSILLQVARILHLGASQGCTSWRTWRFKVKRHLGESQPGWTEDGRLEENPWRKKKTLSNGVPVHLSLGAQQVCVPKVIVVTYLVPWHLLASPLPLFSAWAVLPEFIFQINLVVHSRFQSRHLGDLTQDTSPR